MGAAVVITGAPGAGKSSVLEALGTMLEVERVVHGAIETEELGRGFPALDDDVVVRELERVSGFHRGVGRGLLVVVFTAESDAQLRAVIAATGAEQVLVVCLRASADVLAERLQQREPDGWPGKQALVAHARAIASSAPTLAAIHAAIDTDGREPEEVAGELLAEMRARGLVSEASSP